MLCEAAVLCTLNSPSNSSAGIHVRGDQLLRCFSAKSATPRARSEHLAVVSTSATAVLTELDSLGPSSSASGIRRGRSSIDRWSERALLDEERLFGRPCDLSRLATLSGCPYPSAPRAHFASGSEITIMLVALPSDQRSEGHSNRYWSLQPPNACDV